MEKIDDVFSSFLIEMNVSLRYILKTDHTGVLVRRDRLGEHRRDRSNRIIRVVLTLCLVPCALDPPGTATPLPGKFSVMVARQRINLSAKFDHVLFVLE